MKLLTINLFFWACLLLLSCNTPTADKETKPLPTNAAVTAFDLDARLTKTDSIILFFYDDPYGNDSLRYTRYYTQTSTTDTAIIKSLLFNLKSTVDKAEQLRHCRSEGKVFCYSQGKVFQTIYFSTRCADCCHLYLIKDGFFYYTPLSADFRQSLDVLKAHAAKPVPVT
jgi:hypothetical protein